MIEERLPILFHPDRQAEEQLLSVARAMAADTGPEAFLRQQRAIIDRPDSRPTLASITCPVMVVIGLLGATLLYGDGAITPAISVLSAIEGLKVYAPQTEHVIVPLTVALLT